MYLSHKVVGIFHEGGMLRKCTLRSKHLLFYKHLNAIVKLLYHLPILFHVHTTCDIRNSFGYNRHMFDWNLFVSLTFDSTTNLISFTNACCYYHFAWCFRKSSLVNNFLWRRLTNFLGATATERETVSMATCFVLRLRNSSWNDGSPALFFLDPSLSKLLHSESWSRIGYYSSISSSNCVANIAHSFEKRLLISETMSHSRNIYSLM